MPDREPVSVPRYVFKLVGGLLMMIMVAGGVVTMLGMMWLMVLSFGIAKQGQQLNRQGKQLEAIRLEQGKVRVELKQAPAKVAEEIKGELK
jgi:hypothetical protein